MKRTVFVLGLMLAGLFLTFLNSGVVISGETESATFVVR